MTLETLKIMQHQNKVMLLMIARPFIFKKITCHCLTSSDFFSSPFHISKEMNLRKLKRKAFTQATLLIIGLISYFKKFFQSVLEEVKWDKVQFHGSYPDKNKYTEVSIPI